MNTYLNFDEQSVRPGPAAGSPRLRRLGRLLLLLSLLLLARLTAVHAQPQDGGSIPTAPAADPTGVPIDGGASLLLAGGVGYALRQLRRRRQTKAG